MIFIARCGEPLQEQVDHPFRHLSAWLQHAYPEMKTLKLKQLSRGITLLSNSQKTWKSMDGVAHEINARVSSSALTTRDIDRLRAEAALDTSKKDTLSELVRNLQLVRHALRSAEIAELSSLEDKDMALKFSVDAGLGKPLLTVSLDVPAVSEQEKKEKNGVIRCLIFEDKARQQLLISVGDSLSGGAMLSIGRQLPKPLTLFGASPLDPPEEIVVNQPLLAVAQDLVTKIGPNITDFLSTHENYTVHCIGHSFGGAVAALASAIFEGSLNFPELSKGCSAFRGIAASKLSCTTFGCPPCISRNFRCGRWLSSFVLGDDVIPRLSGKSLYKLKSRLAKAVPSSSGLLSQSISFSSGFLRDTLGVGVHGTKQYIMGGNDERTVAVPGRTYYLKPRRYQKSTSLREVKGSMREDVMWQLDDIFLSKSMLKHHLLHSYISNLDRV